MEDQPPEPTQRWIDVASETDLGRRGAMEVVAEGLIVALFDVGGRLYALDGMCAHQGGPIAKGQLGETDQGKLCVTCP